MLRFILLRLLEGHFRHRLCYLAPAAPMLASEARVRRSLDEQQPSSSPARSVHGAWRPWGRFGGSYPP